MNIWGIDHHVSVETPIVGRLLSAHRRVIIEEERLHALEAEAGQEIEEGPVAVVIQEVEEDRIVALEDPVATLVEIALS